MVLVLKPTIESNNPPRSCRSISLVLLGEEGWISAHCVVLSPQGRCNEYTKGVNMLKYFEFVVRPSVEKLEVTLGVRRRIHIKEESETVQLENNSFYDREIAKDGRKHFIWIPF